MNNGTCCRTLIAHEGPVWALVRHENILVSASQDRTVGGCLADVMAFGKDTRCDLIKHYICFITAKIFLPTSVNDLDLLL